MNEKALKTLEYYKIIDMLEAFATSSIGKNKCRQLRPLDNLTEIDTMQQESADALCGIYQKGSLSFSGVKDVRGSLKRLEVGSTLGIGELLAIRSLLENASRAKAYSRRETENEHTDSLDNMFELIEPLSPLATEIGRCILSEDEISDDASTGLRQVRRSMKLTNDKIHTQLSSFVSGNSRTYLQDAVVTMRNGRYCIPVKAEYKSQVPGMIHDQSSTGSTIFVEPMTIVRLNNEMRELEIQEQKEIEMILSNLSQLAAENLDAIFDDVKLLSELDFIFARAQLAKSQNATEPRFNRDRIIDIKKARHPLIDKHKVVPIDIRIGETFDLLIVTGPNTGGKTVSLKTVGLLTLMGQSGLHIPAFDNSRLSVFREVYADIGDEQSIEQSLSTFSSHMTNVVRFMETADSDSLVLFDELGAGTDPTEGAALAIAILSTLHERGIRAMATTHYSELKVYALSTPGVENASCEFDVETLRPTYRLLIGVPGKSNAFAISQKLGLPLSIIERAKEQISQEDETFEDVLSNLEESRKTIESEREELASYKEEIKTLKEQLETKQDKLDQRKERIIAEANEEAHRILREAIDYADQTMRIFNKAGKDSMSAKDLEKHRSDLRKKMDKAGKKVALKTPQKQKSTLRPQDLSLGDSVKVMSLNVKGTVSSKPDSKGMLFVQMGILRSKVHISDLQLIDEPVITGPARFID